MQLVQNYGTGLRHYYSVILPDRVVELHWEGSAANGTTPSSCDEIQSYGTEVLGKSLEHPQLG